LLTCGATGKVVGDVLVMARQRHSTPDSGKRQLRGCEHESGEPVMPFSI
jgi:hypothetical protein